MQQTHDRVHETSSTLCDIKHVIDCNCRKDNMIILTADEAGPHMSFRAYSST